MIYEVDCGAEGIWPATDVEFIHEKFVKLYAHSSWQCDADGNLELDPVKMSDSWRVELACKVYPLSSAKAPDNVLPGQRGMVVLTSERGVGFQKFKVDTISDQV